MLKLLKIIAEYWKGISSVIGIATFISVGSVKLDRAKHERTERDRKLVEQVENTIKVYTDTVSMHLYRVESKLYEYGGNLFDIQREQKVQKNIMTKEFAKTMTPQQVLEMMNQFDVKKNNNNTGLTPYNGGN
jgi:hypothetical protein